MTTESPSFRWVKSSYSGGGGTCVEWAPSNVAATGVVPVRDSKDPSGPVLAFPAAAFASFTASVKAGTLGAV
ncbi:DUF397 domain-containing protein [Streptomyces sp. NPDC051567]|uniref:DUF397 domain-containing protein n=1 Tax=Streptomyces sp. NPDC051567 TaxID=3365660 RepID=UPI0037ACFC13